MASYEDDLIDAVRALQRAEADEAARNQLHVFLMGRGWTPPESRALSTSTTSVRGYSRRPGP